VVSWLFFEVVGLVVVKGYPKDKFILWWKHSHMDFEQGLKLISDDIQAMELANYALSTNEEVHI